MLRAGTANAVLAHTTNGVLGRGRMSSFVQFWIRGTSRQARLASAVTGPAGPRAKPTLLSHDRVPAKRG